jgi:hypothetical protein
LDGVLLPEAFAKERVERPVKLNKATTGFKFSGSDDWTDGKKSKKIYSWENSFCTLVRGKVRKYQFEVTDVRFQLGGKIIEIHAKKPGYYCSATSESCKKFGTPLKYINFEFCQPMIKVGECTTISIPLKIHKITQEEPDLLSSLTPVERKKTKVCEEVKWKVSKRKLARKARDEKTREKGGHVKGIDKTNEAFNKKSSLKFGGTYVTTLS